MVTMDSNCSPFSSPLKKNRVSNCICEKCVFDISKMNKDRLKVLNVFSRGKVADYYPKD